MKLSEYKNEDALDLLADLLEPVAKMFSDEKLARLIKNGTKLETIRYGLKEHKSEVIAILARLEGVEPKKYNGNIVTMTKSLMDIMNDEELISFFTLQGQTADAIPSGSVTENTEEKGK